MEDALKTLAPPAAPAKGIQVTEKAISKIRSAMEKEGISPEQGGLREDTCAGAEHHDEREQAVPV